MNADVFFLCDTTEIPLFPTITATVTFGEMKMEKPDPSLFVLPEDYEVLRNASMLFRTNYNDVTEQSEASSSELDEDQDQDPSLSSSDLSSLTLENTNEG